MTTTTYKKSDKNKNNYYGKYYTYKRIRNIMSTYFRAKLSMFIEVFANGAAYNLGYTDTDQQRHEATHFRLAQLFHDCPKYESYRGMFGAYKIRGVLFDINPMQQTSYLLSQNDQILNVFSGDVKIALNESDIQFEYAVMADLNNNTSLSRTQKQRVYWKIYQKDFTTVPQNANDLPLGIPYSLIINKTGQLQNNFISQRWAVTMTFYVTFRQSMA